MLLKKLIKSCPKKLLNKKVFGLSSDTRTIKKGDLFFALKGTQYNGEKYIEAALKKGACAAISSKEVAHNNKIIKVQNVKECLGRVCAKFYPKKPKNIIAVTGTNGKSSVADFFHQILSINKLSVATIGTLGVKIKNFKKSNLTSPDIISLHKELQNLKKKNIENILLEASSHGLDQGRLNGINIRAGIFTNFSQDHLDYHKNMRNYLNSKLLLFERILKKRSFIIVDKNISEFKKIKNAASKRKLKKLFINHLEKKYNFSSFKLIGNFQKKNLLMAIKACEISGLNKNQISRCFKKIKSIKGRLELVKVFQDNTKVYVDFAHTPQAIETAINALKSHYKKDITIVFGCGGERDKGKRKKMGQIVNRYCKKIIVTDDNPRKEKPELIRKEIMKNINKNKAIEIGNRTAAINYAIKKSDPNEVILIAGKGHESLQDYGKKKLKISDHEIIKNLRVSNKKSKKEIRLAENKSLINNLIKNKIDEGFIGVSIDSKSIKKGNLFVAIKGKNNDGHDFVNEAISRGASKCIISKNLGKKRNNKFIKVSDTYNFLKNLAYLKRIHINGKVIAITGSSGKTSVKDLIGNLLDNYGETYFSPKSYNNSYGVPLSLCNLETEHKFGVFEIGMSKKGEIKNLSEIVKPDIAIITNVAEAHIENFKSLSHIAQAKGEIIENISNSGTLILDRDSKFYNYFKSKADTRRLKVFTVGYNPRSDLQIIKVKNLIRHKLITIKLFNKMHIFKVKDHVVKNIGFAIAVLKNLNLDIEKIKHKIKKIKILEGRGKIFKVKYKNLNFNLIDESYNANPLSVKQSILNLSNIKNNNHKYVLLGDMLELGKNAKKLHKKLSPIINNSNINKLFIHGNHIMETYKNVKKNKRGNILQCKSDFKELLLPILRNNDYLMIKGSNATGLNKLSKNLTAGRINVI